MSSRILIVEDDAMIQGFIQLTLEHGGYTVGTARSAAEMREQFQQGGIDLIILDLGLPDADGMSLVSEIRATSSVPIIVASARDGASDRVDALERGADDYLTKPFDPTEMLLRIRNLLNRCAAAPVLPVAPTPQPSQPAQPAPQPRQPAQPAPPVPPALHTAPVSPMPLPASVTPAANPVPPAAPPASTPAPLSATESLQAAAKKSAPQPISQAPARASIDKSVIVAGILAVAAFGGAGIYWFTNYRPLGVERIQPAAQNQAGSDTQPRRGALQPPSQPDVRIAQSSNSSSQPAPDNLTRSVTSLSDPAPDPDQSTRQPPPASATGVAPQASLAVSATAWVKNSKCAPLPDVKWWRVKTHLQIVRFVNSEHKGDWQPYLNNWRARLEKLKDISDRGSGIKTGTGEILQGESLAEYIRDTADRIAIIQCLSREARIAAGG